MMVGFLAVALVFGVAGEAPSQPATAQSPTEIANATKFELRFDGGRVAGCTVTATSGNPDVDRYVCDSARSCGDRYSNADGRTACLLKKREELADHIAKNSNRTK